MEISAREQQQRREEEEGRALMEVCAKSRAAAAFFVRAAFESWLAGATQFDLRLPPFAAENDLKLVLGYRKNLRRGQSSGTSSVGKLVGISELRSRVLPVFGPAAV